jgi:photosystem II stability/assembly factor-like uncharacterized protein
MRTTDGGNEWEVVFFDTLMRSDTVDFQGVAAIDSMRAFFVAGRWPVADSFLGGQGSIVRYTYATEVAIQHKDTTYDFYGVHFVDGQNGWVVGGDDRDMDAVVLHTTNAGVNWSEQTVPSATRLLRAVEFVDAQNGWACGRSGTIIHTSDGGQTWELQSCPVDTTLFDIDFADTLSGMIAGNSVVLRTFDGGANWLRCLGGVEESRPTPARAGMRLTVTASPARGRVAFRTSELTGSFTVTLYDAAGSLVRALKLRGQGGSETVTWDGRDEAGNPARSGLYLARLSASAGTASSQFVFLRE